MSESRVRTSWGVLAAAGAATVGAAVMFGAFGAHFLRSRIGAPSLAVYETAVRYQVIGGVGMLAAAILAEVRRSGRMCTAGWIIFAGVLAFSASLYALALGAPQVVGVVTPLGGLMLIAGWIGLAVAAARPVAGVPGS